VLDVARPSRGVLHVLRALVLLGSALGISVAAHATTTGCVDLGSTLLAVGLCAPSGWILTRGEPTVGVLLAWLAAVQVGVHLVLTALCGGPVLEHGLLVVGAHVAAVMVTAVLLRGGDAVLWTAAAARRAYRQVLVRLGRRLRLRLLTLPVVVRVRGAVPVEAQGGVPAAWRCGAPGRRGPPVGAAAS
jgi:hypothetical protein